MATSFIAHRGASYDAPENTLPAFRLAWEQGADGIETDLHLTRDGEIVCIHDPVTGRTSDRTMIVAESSRNELGSIDVGSWKDRRWMGARIPLLGEVLAGVPRGKLVFLEIKCGDEILSPLDKALREATLDSNQVMVISFDIRVVAAVKQCLPSFKASWLTGFKTREDTGLPSPSPEETVITLENASANGVDCACSGSVDERFVRILRDAGKEVHVWTINDPDSAARFLGLGVDSITSDRAGWLKQVMKQSAGKNSWL